MGETNQATVGWAYDKIMERGKEWGSEMDRTGWEPCPMARFGSLVVKTSGYSTAVLLVSYLATMIYQLLGILYKV
jgi:hypothetical protein